MKMNNNYHHLSLYLKCDVLLLAGVFEKFTNSSLKNCILCMIHYLSTPTLSWDAMLNMTKVELELISDVDKYLLFEKSMRTRVSYSSKKHSKANNKYLKSYDPKLESKHIYSDAYNTMVMQCVNCSNYVNCTMIILYHKIKNKSKKTKV